MTKKLMDGHYLLENNDISYLEDILLDSYNNLKIVPYDAIRDVPQEHISQFCVQHGIYQIPTLELIQALTNIIDGEEDKTIEIGAGNGALGKALGITCTDSYMQEIPEIKMLYELQQQAIVKYGSHVKRYDALQAVEFYRPRIVVASWCTHLYNPLEHWREGNVIGIDEGKIIKKVNKYIHIGNESVHRKKPILSKPHQTIKAEWLVSRGLIKENNVIWIWEKDRI